MMSDGKRPGAVSAFRVPMLLLVLAAAPSAGLAQSAPPPGLPPGVYMGEPDYKQATAGTYALDPDHASVIARVSHIGYSYSVFRFDRLSATLGWDPANTAGSSLSAKVETASITSNVKGFGEQLAGDEFLKSRAFPEATFVSTAFRQTSSRRGKVDGQFTLMGKTRAATFDVELVGAGKGFAGQPRMGMNARASINPVDFGLPPLLGDAIEIVVDAEFQRNP
jgi:polyisoprenoid-binding protein YceI